MAYLKLIKREEKGVALIMAVIVMMITLLLSSALLLISYSVFSVSTVQYQRDQSKEVAMDISEELERQITVQFDSYTGTDSNKNQGAASTDDKYPLWFYLRCNINPDDSEARGWPCYDEDEGNMAQAYRYFVVDASGTDASQWSRAADDTSVVLYWYKEEIEATEDAEETEEIKLRVCVTCEKNEQSSTVATTYYLVRGSYTDVDGTGITISDEKVNPNGNQITKNEKWIWNKE